MSKEAMKLALEALKDATLHIWLGDKKGSEANIRAHKAIDVLEEALAKQEQGEPIQVTIKDFVKAVEGKEDLVGRPVYWAQWPNENTTPQQRTWVGLTDEEVEKIYRAVDGNEFPLDFYAEIEAKIKEKNGL